MLIGAHLRSDAVTNQNLHLQDPARYPAFLQYGNFDMIFLGKKEKSFAHLYYYQWVGPALILYVVFVVFVDFAISWLNTPPRPSAHTPHTPCDVLHFVC